MADTVWSRNMVVLAIKARVPHGCGVVYITYTYIIRIYIYIYIIVSLEIYIHTQKIGLHTYKHVCNSITLGMASVSYSGRLSILVPSFAEAVKARDVSRDVPGSCLTHDCPPDSSSSSVTFGSYEHLC